ncbi:ribosomal protein L12E/L44/L45/RPP1/RPP2 [Peribacillus deserti]|uniref:Ribosomal protein L12E/L44/L45/RPP1/RPP2 n=1 Tax=Peribacillus deserti TaxID=673318 RepID=A0ABS2QJI3_9BACI|nr:DUF2624 family protein [Peribacillus deserti]MBM7693322.1 ribosomal protein L12E/L44/L45/RPP1/RPP2 [Peribacillus deserti]
MKFYEMMVNQKINNIKRDELLKIGRQYGVILSSEHAEKIASMLNGKNINIFDLEQRQQVIQNIAAIAGKRTALQIESLFKQLT